MKCSLKSTLFLTLAVLVASFFVNCATIIHGTMQDVSVTSNPESAEITIKTAGGVVSFSGITPASVKLDRKNEYDVFVNLAGYQEVKIHINKEFDALFLGNVLCGGIIGMIIDAANGAMNKLEPNVIDVSLVTASLDKDNKEVYAVFRALDSEGQLRTLSVPLIKI